MADLKYRPDDDEVPAPRLYIQWKGTDLCGDFHCVCGAHHHIDAEFVYAIRCTCGRTFATPTAVALRELSEPEPCTHHCRDDEGAPQDDHGRVVIDGEVLDDPPKPNEALRQLMHTAAPWEKPDA